jgi:putative peptidoglycan lipid II flippase
MSQMLKSSSALGMATITSRVLGVVREALYARFMGDGMVAGAFKLAFMIPNLFRRLLGEGALTAAFIPIFKEKERTEGEEQMWRAANAVISGLIIAACAITGLVLIGLSLLLAFNSSGVQANGSLIQTLVHPGTGEIVFGGGRLLSEQTELLLRLLRIMFPYMILISLTAIFMGMLNARGRFFIPALGANILNIILIAIVLFVAPGWGEALDQQIFALAVGVLIAGCAQAAYQVPSLYREGFRWRWVSPLKNATVQVVIQKMVPGMLGVAAFQFNVLITMGIAYAVKGAQTVASFDYAVRLMEFPQGVIGISLATFLLPALSGLAADKNYPEFRATLRQSLGYLAFVNLIATTLLIALAEPIVRLLFERGQFDPDSTSRAAFALACLAPGLVAFSAVGILARAFYALGDTKTPMIISVFCLGINIILVLMLIWPFAQGGLGLANSLTSILNAGLLLYALRRKLARLDFEPLTAALYSIVPAALLGGGLAWLVYVRWDAAMGRIGILEKIGAVFIPMVAAGLVYWTVLFLLKNPQAREFLALAKNRLK